MTPRRARRPARTARVALTLAALVCVVVVATAPAVMAAESGEPDGTLVPTADDPTPDDPSADDPEDQTVSMPVAIVSTIATLLVAVGAWRLQSRRLQRLHDGEEAPARKPSASGPPPGTVTTLLDAARLMDGASNATEVARIAAAEALRLCHGDHAAVLRWDGHTLHVLYATDTSRVADPTPPGSILRAVATSGRPVAQVVSADEGVVGTAALAAAALTTEMAGTNPVGPVLGVLAVLRRRELPMAGAELQQLSLLAPIVAEALAVTTTNDTPSS